MKRFISMFILVAACVSIGSAQQPSMNAAVREIIVPDLSIDGVTNGLATTIANDSVARMAALPTQTIYILKRNGYYPVVSAINNYGYFLYIKAATGAGFKPLLYPSPVSGTTYTYNLNFRSSGKLEGLTLEAVRPTGGVNNRYINIYQNSKLYVKDCEVLHDRGSAFALLADSCSIFIEDCFVHSCGHPKVLGGNGRLVDVRATTFVDSIVVKNTTFFNLTDRIIRNMGTKVDHLIFDHNTGLSTEGYHGGLQAGKTRELTITNNIFYNMIELGSFKKRTAVGTTAHEQTQPEKSLMYVVTVDTPFTASYNFTVRNNNIFWADSIKALWLKWKDSTDVPGTITPTLMKAMLDSSKAYFTEALTFQAPPPSLYAFVDSALLAPNALVLPENWWFTYQDANGLGPINASYGTSAQSYTKGDLGYPLGDLNWYPTLKARWLLGAPADVEVVGSIPTSPTLSQNYPNPFNPNTVISYQVSVVSNVDLRVFDMLGREVAVLASGVQNPGSYKVDFDATKLASGMYMYRLSAGTFSSVKKMLLMK